jgi:hypothetical protein
MFEGMYLRQGEVCWYSNQTDNVGMQGHLQL